jgi:hypothetical protein
MMRAAKGGLMFKWNAKSRAAVLCIGVFAATMIGAASASAESAINLCIGSKAGQVVKSGGEGTGKCPAPTATITYDKVALPKEESAQQNLLSILSHAKYIASEIDGKPTIQFSGVNVQIVDGAGTTRSSNGSGNLVIGYDENTGKERGKPGAQTGSHNLVLGEEQEFTGIAGIVAGIQNTNTGIFASVSGENNTASGPAASVSGGFANVASGVTSSVSGGNDNSASNSQSSVAGGSANVASGKHASVTGGANNKASGEGASISGGSFNTAEGTNSSIFGDQALTASSGVDFALPRPVVQEVSKETSVPNNTDFAGTAECPGGTEVTGGGVFNGDISPSRLFNDFPKPAPNSGWDSGVKNESGHDGFIISYAMCMGLGE